MIVIDLTKGADAERVFAADYLLSNCAATAALTQLST
jgi:hypothetical protein